MNTPTPTPFPFANVPVLAAQRAQFHADGIACLMPECPHLADIVDDAGAVCMDHYVQTPGAPFLTFDNASADAPADPACWGAYHAPDGAGIAMPADPAERYVACPAGGYHLVVSGLRMV